MVSSDLLAKGVLLKMPLTLIYHEPEEVALAVSCIDEVIRQIVIGQQIDIACPYLGLPYLNQITKECSSWRLLSDVEQWVISQPRNSRSKVYDFIATHRDRVHHYPKLHAKVIVAEEKALVGSANFSEEGVTKRAEMCALLADPTQVSELRKWFGRLWELSTPPDMDELAELIRCVAEYRSDHEPPFSLTSPAPKINTQMVVPLDRRPNTVIKQPREVHDALVERLSLAPTREWITEYLNLIKELIDFCGLAWNDERLALTLPKKETRLPVNINQRYVLNAAFARGSKAAFLFILGGDFVRYRRLQRHAGRYSPWRGEAIEDVPYWWEKYPETPNEVLSGEFKEEWKNAVRSELRRGKRSGFRKYHDSRIYDAAVDLEYRASLLDEAFRQTHER